MNNLQGRFSNELTEQDVDAIIELMNIATKTEGFNVAEASIFLRNKMFDLKQKIKMENENKKHEEIQNQIAEAVQKKLDEKDENKKEKTINKNDASTTVGKGPEPRNKSSK